MEFNVLKTFQQEKFIENQKVEFLTFQQKCLPKIFKMYVLTWDEYIFEGFRVSEFWDGLLLIRQIWQWKIVVLWFFFLFGVFLILDWILGILSFFLTPLRLELVIRKFDRMKTNILNEFKNFLKVLNIKKRILRTIFFS